MLPRNHPDRIQIAFDDHRLVANAGLLLPATLALHLGLPELVQQRLDLGDAPGRANPGDKIMTLVASALAGGDCIDDADALRTGGTAHVLGFTDKAPSTLGTFLRSFRWGQGPTHGAGRQRLLYPRRGRRLPPDECPLLHHHPPAHLPAESHRGDTRRGLDADSLLDGRCRCGRDHLQSLSQKS